MQQEAWALLKAIKQSSLTAQQKKTLRGQILAGDIIGAQKGFKRLTIAKDNQRKEAK